MGTIRSFWKKLVKPPIPDETLDPHRPVDYWDSAKLSRGRVALGMLAFFAALSAYFSLWVLIAGLSELSADGNDSDPFIITGRSFTWEFVHAWHFFVPVFAVLSLSVIALFGSMIYIVTHPQDGRSTPAR